MFDIEKVIYDGRWWANSGLIPENCKSQVHLMADTIEQQHIQIQNLERRLNEYLAKEFK